MKKAIISILLLAGIGVLVWWLYSLFATPIKFEEERIKRETAVVQRLKDIRTAERAFKVKNQRFAANFDELISFINNDSMTVEMNIGSEDDSVAMAQGKVKRYVYQIAIKDTLFPKDFVAEEIRYIPYSDLSGSAKSEFQLDTGSVRTESSMTIGVFEAYAPYTTFLGDLDQQELVNFRDERVKTLMKEDGLKVGSLNQANNEAGNWE